MYFLYPVYILNYQAFSIYSITAQPKVLCSCVPVHIPITLESDSVPRECRARHKRKMQLLNTKTSLQTLRLFLFHLPQYIFFTLGATPIRCFSAPWSRQDQTIFIQSFSGLASLLIAFEAGSYLHYWTRDLDGSCSSADMRRTNRSYMFPGSIARSSSVARRCGGPSR